MYLIYKDYVDDILCVDWANSPHDNPHLDLIADLNEPINLEDSIAETLILSDVLEHIYRPKELLLEIYRLLKPEGILLMNVPFMYWLHEEPHDYYRYTEFALKRMLFEAGFEVIEFKANGGFLLVLDDLLCKNLPMIPKIGKLMRIISHKFLSVLSSSKFGKRINDRSSKKFPLNYCLVAKKVNHSS